MTLQLSSWGQYKAWHNAKSEGITPVLHTCSHSQGRGKAGEQEAEWAALGHDITFQHQVQPQPRAETHRDE